MSKQHIYFISDLHLGTPDETSSRERERKFVQWMEEVSKDAAEIFIIGDLFDFWHEYKTVVPKGFIRTQAAIAKAVEQGIPVSLFTGNHDLWQQDYFEKELGVKLYRNPIERTWNGKTFYIGHGDGLGPGDHGFKWMKKVFTNPVCQWLFRWIHPDLGMRLAGYFSYKSRFANEDSPTETFLGEDKEWLIQYCKRKSTEKQYDYFVFGHRHLPLSYPINETSRYINTGDWISYFTYAVFDGGTLELKTYKP